MLSNNNFMVFLDIYTKCVLTTHYSASDVVFNQSFNYSLVHQVVLAALDFEKIGTKAQKTKGEVRGGGCKPWKQKGTGRARVGSIRSPLWRGGGRIFAARPLLVKKKVNKKMYKLAMACVLSELVCQNRLFVIDAFVLIEPSTKLFFLHIRRFYDIKKTMLLIVPSFPDDVIYRSGRNMEKLRIKNVDKVTIVDLFRFDVVVIFKDVVALLEKMVVVYGK